MVLKERKNDIFKRILYLLLIFPFFQPRSISSFSKEINDIIYDMMPIMCLVLISIMYIKKSKMSRIIVFILLFFATLGISTSINNGDFNNFFQITVKAITFCMVIDYGLKNDTKIFLSVLNFYLILLFFTNFITMILYPNGMYVDNSNYSDNWFYGYRNIHILFIFPTIVVNFLYAYVKDGKVGKRNVIFFILCIISLVYADSGTSIIGVFFIALFLIIKKYAKSIKGIAPYVFMIASFVIWFLIVILRIQNIFSFIIVDVLGRSLTFTGRIYIWDDVINMISQRKILGYGVEFKNFRLLKTSIPSYHAHDQLLEVMYQSGFMGLFCFLLIIFECGIQLNKYKKYEVSEFLAICIFSLLIMMITEAYSLNCIVYMFVIFGNVKYFIRKENTSDEKAIQKDN